MSARHESPRMSVSGTYSRDQSARQAIPAAATPRTTPLRPRESRWKQPEFKSAAAAARSGQSGERARARGREQSKVTIGTVHSQTMRSFDQQSRTSRDARDVNLQVLEGRRASE